MMGAQAYIDSMSLWAGLPTTAARITAVAAKLTAQAASAMTVRRRWVIELTLAALRLRRALLTGFTFGYDNEREGQEIPINQLRREFVSLVEKYAPDALGADSVPTGDEAPEKPHRKPEKAPSSPSQGERVDEPIHEADGSEIEDYRDVQGDDREVAVIEILPEIDDLLEAEEKRAAQEADDIFETVGIKRALVKIKDVEDPEVELEQVGKGVAAHSERMAMNAGRRTELDLGKVDPRVNAFARIHIPHDDAVPCGFCAMLLSRGAIYKTKRTAGGIPNALGDFDHYHTGDHCRTISLFEGMDYKTNPEFAVNRIVQEFWKNHRDEWGDMGGETDVDNWRRWFRKFGRDHEASPSDNWEEHFAEVMAALK